ncbi:DUF6498-containing protein [Salinadaptatus halalkaliphilus]|uniref:DUF6498-containing protein n=1 Tax=Salinadaptatus halalkaliphilus TaxID=2419781 RepID=UPI001FEA4833|nr:DUF6498-containing protein [Salinadaptatus halalkaliphilus]
MPPVVGFGPILVANLLPLVGVVYYGWDPATLVAIYALELLLSFPLAAAKALFARRRPPADPDDSGVVSVSSDLTTKRGRVTVVSWLPPIYPRNVPFVTSVIVGVAWVCLFVGVVLGEAISLAAAIAQPAVVASIAALFVGQLLEFRREYLRGGGYETVSPYTVIETPARQAFFLLFVLMVVPGIGTGEATFVLAAFVLVKLLVEWSAFRASRGAGGRLAAWLSGPDEATELDDPPQVPDDEPDARVSTDGKAALLTGVCHVLTRPAPFYASIFFIVWLVAVGILGGPESSLAFTVGATLVVVGSFVLLLAGKSAEFYLQYGPLEYRRYGDRLVAYDTWLDEPQWTASVDVLRNVAVVQDRLPDRLLETRTIAVTTGWDDDDTQRQLGPVAAPETLVATFELPVHSTDLEAIDRRVVGIVVAIVAVIVLVAGLAIWPWGEPVVVFYAVFLLPFVGIVLLGLWNQAYPDPA